MTGTEHRWLLGGGIGTGKSTVRRFLDESGVFTVDADTIGHAVLEPGGPAFAEVAARWPSTVVGGRIERSALASIVFADAGELIALESMTHPYIFGRIRGLLEEVSGVAVVEIPLWDKAPEGSWGRIVVDCDDEIRLHRLVERGLPEEEAKARMSIQPSRSQWLSIANLVVPNHGTEDDLRKTVTHLLPLL